MTKGHVFLAQNSDSVNYIRQAYALALSIKAFNKVHNQTCLITNDLVPDEYKHAFDYIEPIPWGDLASNSRWKIENRWKVIYVTPFDENLVYDVDMFLTRSNDHWWDHLTENDLAFTTEVTTYRNEKVVDNFYRKTFVENSLPNIYTGVYYFKKTKPSYEFFKWLDFIVSNWREVYKKYLKPGYQSQCSIDLSAAIALKFSGIERFESSILTFAHMKPKVQNWKIHPDKWSSVIDIQLDKNLNLTVGNFFQTKLFHYVEDDFLTNDILSRLENYGR